MSENTSDTKPTTGEGPSSGPSGPSTSGKTNEALVVEEGIPPWLERIIRSLPHNADNCLYTFTAVLYVLMYESGFMTLKGPENLTSHFDARVMKQLNSMTDVIEEGNSLKIKFYIYPYVKYCLLIVTKVEDLIIVNLYVPLEEPQVITLTFLADHHFEWSDGVCQLHDLKKVSYSFKSQLEAIRCILHIDAGNDCTFASLPYELKTKICLYLPLDSFGRLSLTCRNMLQLQEDELIWKKLLIRRFKSFADYPEKDSDESWADIYMKHKRKCEMLEHSGPRNFNTRCRYHLSSGVIHCDHLVKGCLFI